MHLEVDIPRIGYSVGEYVYEIIKKNIINLNMPPGTRVSEKEISYLLNVSRTPVREAFIKLSREGLIYVVPQRGSYISHIDLNAVEDARFIRECIEKAVMEIATENFPIKLLNELERNIDLQRQLLVQKKFFEFLMMDEEFHKTIFVGCNKASIWSYIEQINSQYNRIRMLTFIADINWSNVLEQHVEILNCIKNQDRELGQEVISNHLKKLIIEQEELKKRYPDYFESIEL